MAAGEVVDKLNLLSVFELHAEFLQKQNNNNNKLNPKIFSL